MRTISKTILGLSAFSLAAVTAAAAPVSPGKGSDSKKLICRTVQEIGSRLNKTRACHTIAEWAELRRLTRETIQRIQDTRPAHLAY